MASVDTARRDQRLILADGAAFNVMVGLGETYVPAFALAIGLGDVVAGLVASLPMLAGAVLQLVTPLAVRRLGSYRRWVVWCASLQALSLLPPLVGALVGRLSAGWLFAAMAMYWGFGLGTGPAWNAWIGSLVPLPIRAVFFARRTRYCQAALLLALIAGGQLLERIAPQSATRLAFAMLFGVAIAARLLSAWFLSRQSEMPGLAARHRALSAREVRSTLVGSDAGRLLVYLVATQIAVYVAAPYFTPYMLGPLGLSYWGFTALTAVSFVARIVVLPVLGRIVHARGTRPVFRLGALAITPLPALWLVSDSFGYLVGVQILAGVAWAALELATMLSFLEGFDDSERASILTVYNLASALAIAAGSAIGALVLSQVPDTWSAYAILFGVSSAGRLLALRLLPSLRTPVAPVGEMAMRTVALRPSIGALERPILASMEKSRSEVDAG